MRLFLVYLLWRSVSHSFRSLFVHSYVALFAWGGIEWCGTTKRGRQKEMATGRASIKGRQAQKNNGNESETAEWKSGIVEEKIETTGERDSNLKFKRQPLRASSQRCWMLLMASSFLLMSSAAMATLFAYWNANSSKAHIKRNPTHGCWVVLCVEIGSAKNSDLWRCCHTAFEQRLIEWIDWLHYWDNIIAHS